MKLGRVLIWLKPRFIGDAVMATCLVEELAKASDSRFLRCGKVNVCLFADQADQLQFVDAAKIKNPVVFLRHVRELRAMHFDAVVIVDRSFRSALASRLAGVPLRVGHATEGRAWLLTHPVMYDAEKFEAECYLDLLARLGIACGPAVPRLAVSAKEFQEGQRLVAGCMVGVNPGGRDGFKHLPYATTAKVASMLQERGFPIVLLGGRQDSRHVEALTNLGLKPEVDLVGKTGIREALGALANLKLVFGSDSGLMHMAAGVGTPTVTVFGKEPASKWGYPYHPHTAIQAPKGRTDRVEAEQVLAECLRILGG